MRVDDPTQTMVRSFRDPWGCRNRIASLALGLLLAIAAPTLARGDSCESEITARETALRMPFGLLHAMAMAESGRWDHDTGASQAWPWTVTSGEGSFHLASKDEAVGMVHHLQREGRRNIDVGCMQVNLQHHPAAFESLDQAFDPSHNVAYAARYLLRLWRETGSWLTAVAAYHNRDPERGHPYLQRVLQRWHQNRAPLIEAQRPSHSSLQAGRQHGRAMMLEHLHTQAVRSGRASVR